MPPPKESKETNKKVNVSNRVKQTPAGKKYVDNKKATKRLIRQDKLENHRAPQPSTVEEHPIWNDADPEDGNRKKNPTFTTSATFNTSKRHVEGPDYFPQAYCHEAHRAAAYVLFWEDATPAQRAARNLASISDDNATVDPSTEVKSESTSPSASCSITSHCGRSGTFDEKIRQISGRTPVKVISFNPYGANVLGTHPQTGLPIDHQYLDEQEALLPSSALRQEYLPSSALRQEYNTVLEYASNIEPLRFGDVRTEVAITTSVNFQQNMVDATTPFLGETPVSPPFSSSSPAGGALHSPAGSVSHCTSAAISISTNSSGPSEDDEEEPTRYLHPCHHQVFIQHRCRPISVYSYFRQIALQCARLETFHGKHSMSQVSFMSELKLNFPELCAACIQQSKNTPCPAFEKSGTTGAEWDRPMLWEDFFLKSMGLYKFFYNCSVARNKTLLTSVNEARLSFHPDPNRVHSDYDLGERDQKCLERVVNFLWGFQEKMVALEELGYRRISPDKFWPEFMRCPSSLRYLKTHAACSKSEIKFLFRELAHLCYDSTNERSINRSLRVETMMAEVVEICRKRRVTEIMANNRRDALCAPKRHRAVKTEKKVPPTPTAEKPILSVLSVSTADDTTSSSSSSSSSSCSGPSSPVAHTTSKKTPEEQSLLALLHRGAADATTATAAAKSHGFVSPANSLSSNSHSGGGLSDDSLANSIAAYPATPLSAPPQGINTGTHLSFPIHFVAATDPPITDEQERQNVGRRHQQKKAQRRAEGVNR